jgi:hypothetical protein
MIAPASQRVIMQPRAGRCVDRGGSAQAPDAGVRQETGSGAAAEKALSVTTAIKNRDSYDSTVSQDLPAISSSVHLQPVTSGPALAVLKVNTCGVIANTMGSVPVGRQGEAS